MSCEGPVPQPALLHFWPAIPKFVAREANNFWYIVTVQEFAMAVSSPVTKPAKKIRSAKPPTSTNPLLGAWTGAHALPPFAKIEAKHFKPALEAAFRAHKSEI